MAVNIDIVRQAIATSAGGTQDWTVSGHGTPKAAIFIWSLGTTDGTAATHAHFGMGITDGTRNYLMGYHNDEDGVTSTDTWKAQHDDSCIWFSTEGTGTETIDHTFNSWITDGVRTNVNTADGSGYLVTCVLIGGSDVSAYAGHADVGNTTDLTTDITAPGFEPDIVIGSTIDGVAITDPNGQTWTENGWGFAKNAGTQRGYYHRHRAGQATSEPVAWVETAGGAGITGGSGLDFYLEHGTYDASGFSVTTRGGPGNSSQYVYLALKFANHSSAVFDCSTPTSTGNDAVTGLGFTPQFVMEFMHSVETADSNITTGDAGAHGVAVFDGTNEFSTTIAIEDNVGTTNCQSLSDNTANNLPDHTGTAMLTSSFVSFDSGGYTKNFSAVDAAAKLWFGWAVEEDAAAPAAGRPMTPNKGYW